MPVLQSLFLKILAVPFIAMSLWFLAAPALAEVGFSQFRIQTKFAGSIPVTIWYPTNSASTKIERGPFSFFAAENSMPLPGPHPLIIISHGASSSQLTHSNLALHLAASGYVVASPTHAYDNFQDGSGAGTAEVISSRARTVTAIIDRVTAPNPLGINVNPEQIGVAGFSAGGATALALVGARPVMADALHHCKTKLDPFCRFVDPDDPRFKDTKPIAELSDSRISSVIVLAPVTAYFSDVELAKITTPIFVFAPGRDNELSPTLNAGRLRDLIQSKITLYDEPDAGHFSILPVFPESVWKEVPPVLRTDVAGFDRAAFHKRLFERLTDFLDKFPNQ